MPFRIDDYSETTSSLYLPAGEMHAQLNLHLIFNRGEAYFTGAANLKIAQFKFNLDKTKENNERL